eukprot:COSAG01_NODE_34639_length_544_cov_1.094382_1_plen_95_part_01
MDCFPPPAICFLLRLVLCIRKSALLFGTVFSLLFLDLLPRASAVVWAQTHLGYTGATFLRTGQAFTKLCDLPSDVICHLLASFGRTPAHILKDIA